MPTGAWNKVRGDVKMELLRVYVNVLETKEVISEQVTIRMILFDGYCRGEYFNGEIENGGVDTQVITKEGKVTLSARYVLKGHDGENNPCQLFIENNGEVIEYTIYTKPTIYTDSKKLAWIQEIEWRGKVETIDGQLVIIILNS